MVEVPRQHQEEPWKSRSVPSASLVEGLGVKRRRFLQVVGHEPNSRGSDVMAVTLGVVGKSAHAPAVVLEEMNQPGHVQLSGCP